MANPLLQITNPYLIESLERDPVGTLENPGEAKPIRYGALYDATQAVQDNPLGNIVAGGLARYFQDLATGQPGSYGRSLEATLDVPLPGAGTLAKIGLTGAGLAPLLWLMGRGGDSAMQRYSPRFANQAGVIGYHGTPHRFEPVEGHPHGRFDPEKSAAVSKGHDLHGKGHYLTESERTALAFRGQTPTGLFSTRLEVDGKKLYPHHFPIDSPQRQALTNLSLERGIAGQISSLRETARLVEDGSNYDAAADWLESLGSRARLYQPGAGYIYKADIDDAAVEKMIDLDRPLFEQPEILKILESPELREFRSQSPWSSWWRSNNDIKSKDGHWLIEENPGIEQLLKDKGVPGAKYSEPHYTEPFDGTVEKVHRTFVIFHGAEDIAPIIAGP